MGFFVPLAAAGLVRLRRCSGESRCRKVVCRGGKRSVSHPIREIGGEIFTDYYFGEANTANKSDKLHNNAKSENLNWGGFPGCYNNAEGVVDRSQLASSPNVLAVAHKKETLESNQRCTTITIERHNIKEKTQGTETRYGSIVGS